MIREGAVAVDLRAETAKNTVDAMMEQIGMGIGVACTGLSGAGDIVVVTAGPHVSPSADGCVPDAKWGDRFRVTGPCPVADETARTWEAQALPGSLVVTTSDHAVVLKRSSYAGGASKAAANHLPRKLAVAYAPDARFNAAALASVVEGSAMVPRKRVIASLANHGLPYENGEDDSVPCFRLARIYAKRTRTKQPVTPEDQAEVAFFHVSDRLGRTTGQIVHVDGGLAEA